MWRQGSAPLKASAALAGSSMRTTGPSHTAARAAASPTAKQQGSARTCLCSHAFATISGPMPAGSPRDIAQGAMLILSIHVLNYSQLQRPAEGHADRCASAYLIAHPEATSLSSQKTEEGQTDGAGKGEIVNIN